MANAIKPSEISEVLLSQLRDIKSDLQFEEIGKVLQVSDGVVRIYGLDHAEAGELLDCGGGVMAVVMNLEPDNVGAVLMGPTDLLKEGAVVRRTRRIASIPVGEELVGRVVDPLGNPLDGLGNIGGEKVDMPLERKAPGVIYRQPVHEPLQTGLKAIDAMIPIGRGQRELIIGDRQTGKTAVAIDTIINQRDNFLKGIRSIASMWPWARRVPPSPASSRPSATTAPWTTPSSSPPPPRIRPPCSIMRLSPAQPSASTSATRAATPSSCMTTFPSRPSLTVRCP